MSSYNKLNGTYTSESKYLLTDILRDDWGFKGLVMSDWFGGQTAPAQIKAGNDLLEPGTKFQWDALKKAFTNGELPMTFVDTSVKRILKMVLGSRKMQRYAYQNNPDLKAHAQTAQQSASEGIVLLKNENTLPLQNKKNIALFGVTSYDFIAGGTGSGDVNEAYTVSLGEGLKNKGYEINKAIEKSFEAHKAANAKAFVKPEGMKAMFVKYNPPQWIPSSEEIAQSLSSADIGIITIGRNSGEGSDRKEKDDFLLTSMEQQLIEVTCKAFHQAGKKVVVVLNIGGVIETASWKNLPDAIVLAWQGGQEGGNSVANVLSGEINPSGKLPMTFPIHLNDHASNANFPQDSKPMAIFDLIGPSGTKPEKDQVRNHDYTIYEEGIYVGYRHFDKANMEVSYPFGYGLSYTQFKYSDMSVAVLNDTMKVDFKVSNTGTSKGKEVVQIYSSKPDSRIDRPVQELKAFAKTSILNPGETANLTFKIPLNELNYWNEQASKWTIEKGQYILHASSTSRDIRLSKDILIE
jgi:beta-glucosidase